MNIKVTKKNTNEAPDSILILYHCKSNTGYAIETLELMFWRMALKVFQSPCRVYLSYTSYDQGLPKYTPDSFDNIIEFNPYDRSSKSAEEFGNFITKNNIKVIFGFDQPPNLPYYKIARKSGVKTIISYYGAPMSSINHGLRLALKKIQLRFFRHSPDLYIFESRSMKDTAVHGRGVPETKTAVCYMGVDTNKFKPDPAHRYYAHQLFGLEKNKKLIFYSGHFESRKGVAVLVQAANQLAQKRDDFTFVLFGNKQGEEQRFKDMLSEKAFDKVIFGGYRQDLNKIHRSCHVGTIASTGWDSFTVSSIEMQASGLPLLVSDLPGLNETVIENETGFTFPPGDAFMLADLVNKLLSNEQARTRLAINARRRADTQFTLANQLENLSQLLIKWYGKV